MSVQTDPIPPVPEHTPPLKEDEITRASGKFLTQVWTRWFVSLRDKINVLDASLVNLAGVSGSGILVKNGAAWLLRTITGTTDRIIVTDGSGAGGDPTIDVVTADLIEGTNVTFTGSGVDRIINNGSGNLTINAAGGGSARAVVSTITSTAGVIDIDYSLGDYFIHALDENVTSITFSNLPAPPVGISLAVRFQQDATPWTVAWPVNFDWPSGVPGVVSTGMSVMDLLSLTSFDQGTVWQAELINGGSLSFTYLDDLPIAPQVTFGLSKLISTATEAFVVREDGGNTTMPIGFIGDALDVAALTSFVGINNGFIESLTDQTGNGFDAVQATLAKQPMIVSAGSYLGYVLFDGTDDLLEIPALTLGTPYLGMYSKIRYLAIGGTQILAECAPDWAQDQGYLLFATSVMQMAARSTPNSTTQKQFTFVSSPALTTTGTIAALWKRTSTMGDTENVYLRDNVSQAASPVSDPAGGLTGNFVSGVNMGLGGRPGGSVGPSNIELSNFVIYIADSSSISTQVNTIIA